MRNRIAVLVFLFFALLAPLYAAENSTELYQSGTELALSGKIDEAIVVFKRVVEISPRFSLGHYGLGKAYLMKKDMNSDAIVHLKRSVECDRRFAKGYFYLGMAYYFSGKYVAAVAAYKECIRNDSGYIEALYNIGAIYDIMDRDRNSAVFYSRYVKARKKDDSEIQF